MRYDPPALAAQSLVAPQAANRKLRILQVVPTYFPAIRYGGPIRSVHGLACALAARGHDVHVFTTSVDGPNDLDVPDGNAVDLDGVHVHYFPVRHLRRFYWSPPMRAALREAAPRFDIMHLHSVFLWPTWAAARIAKSARVPYLLAPRGSLGREVIRRKSKYVKSAWIRLIEQRNLLDAAGLHVTAELEATEIRALGLRLPRIFCLPNGVSVPVDHSPLAEGPYRAIRKPYALFLSRITEKKGLDRLIEAWRFVPKITLIIAGNDETGYQKHLEKLVDLHQVGERVRFVGPVSDENKWALYESALLFILPSYAENFGNVVAEAMAMGCPVIITPEVGIARLVEDCQCGIIVDGTPSKLAQSILELAGDADRRRLMAERGRKAVRQHLSWESVAGRTENVYLDITGLGASTSDSAAPCGAESL